MSRFVGFMRGRSQYGRWVPEQDITARAVLGGATIDFSQAIFTHTEITVHSTAFWGGVTIIVPPNVAVEQNGRAILGGFGGSGGLYHSNTGQSPALVSGSSAGITIKVSGTAMMGAITAAVNKKAPPAQLVSAEEAARILREVPEEPSTTRQDMYQQAIQEALGRHLGGFQPPGQVPVVQGIPVEADNTPFKSPAPSAPAPERRDWKQELKDLKELFDTGVLTEDEFQKQKGLILARESK